MSIVDKLNREWVHFETGIEILCILLAVFISQSRDLLLLLNRALEGYFIDACLPWVPFVELHFTVSPNEHQPWFLKPTHMDNGLSWLLDDVELLLISIFYGFNSAGMSWRTIYSWLDVWVADGAWDLESARNCTFRMRFSEKLTGCLAEVEDLCLDSFDYFLVF
jgi:hypothetical protein